MQQPTPDPIVATATIDTPEYEVREFLKEFASVVQLGELERILRYYTPDVIAFDMMPPLEISGVEQYRKAWQECFIEVFDFPVEFDIQPRKVIVNGDTAVIIGLAHVKGRFKKSGEVENWLRGTTVLKKLNGEWKIAHEHNSVPLDQNMKGLMDLRPAEDVH